MSDCPSVLFLCTRADLRAALACAVLPTAVATPLCIELAALHPAPLSRDEQAVLTATGHEPLRRVLDGISVDLAAHDLVITLDDAAQLHVDATAATGASSGTSAGPMRWHLPGHACRVDRDGALACEVEIRTRFADLVERGLLVVIAARRRRRALVPEAQVAAMPTASAPILAPAGPTPPPSLFHEMIGASPAMQALHKAIRKAARSSLPVLVSGETGTGKELVAQAIHRESARRGGAFVAVNCGTLPEHLAESELFGHVRGAFTGAVRGRRGKFGLADGGTIFLDEVGELPPPIQVKLLRVLQEQCFEPVGGEETFDVDVRIICATHRDLRQGVADGWFREDLYYRMNVLEIRVPPLRERKEDIPLLVAHEFASIGQASGRYFRVTDDAVAALMRHDWPGNVRELLNLVQRVAVNASSDEINRAMLVPQLPGRTPAPGLQRAPAVRGRPPKLDAAAVRKALEESAGNRTRAARLLGVGRNTLYRYLSDGRPGAGGTGKDAS